MGIITSSITYPAEKIAKESPIPPEKIAKLQFSWINGEFAKYMQKNSKQKLGGCLNPQEIA